MEERNEMAYACIILFEGREDVFSLLWKHALFRGTSVLNARLMERRGFFSMKSRHRKGFHCCGTSFTAGFRAKRREQNYEMDRKTRKSING